MEQIEFRAVIKDFYLKGYKAGDIKAELDSVHGESAPSLQTIYYWVNKFKRGRTRTFDAPRSGRPIVATTEEIIDKIHGIVMNDRRVRMVEIARAIGISIEQVHKILHEDLGMKTLSARWVPRLLTVDQKRTRKNISQQCLEMF